MFSCLFFLTRSDIDKCAAPRKFAPPVPGMKLRLVQMITRHGERTPQATHIDLSATDNWVCDSEDAISGYVEATPETHYRTFTTVLDKRFNTFKPNCRIGDLTIGGMEQHYQLGKAARQHYVDDLKFLPEEMDPTQFKFISSPFDRCFKSVQSFLVGFYEPKSDNEVLNIETGTEVLSSLFPAPKQCKELNNQTNTFYELPSTKQYLNETWEKVRDLTERVKLEKTSSNLISICDWAVTYICAQDKLPSFLNDELLGICKDTISYYHYNNYEQNPNVPISHTMRHMYKIMDEILGQDSPIKFVLIGAHDSTITALLVFLGVHLDQLPPFASHISMEIWVDEKTSESYVRFVYNGEPLTIKKFGKDVVRLDDFRSWSEPNIQHCMDIPI